MVRKSLFVNFNYVGSEQEGTFDNFLIFAI